MKTRTANVILVLIVILGVMGVTDIGQAVAQSPSPADQIPVQLSIAAQADPDPLMGGERAALRFTLSAMHQPDTVCYGIPKDPVDVIFVVDNSASAGKGPGSNLELTRQWLKEFITLAEQQGAVGDPPQRSRIGLVAGTIGTHGTELYWQTLSEDYAELQEKVDELPAGAETGLTEGITRTITVFHQRARPHVRQVLVLMLHDKVVLDVDNMTEAVAQAKQEGIDVYLIINSLNVADEHPANVLDESLALSIVDRDHLAMDPTIEQLRGIFVRMTGGSADVLAQDLTVVAVTTPDALSEPELSPPGTVLSNTVQWQISQLAAQEEANLVYRGTVSPLTARHGQMDVTVSVVYLDCNGQQRSLSQTWQFQVREPEATPTPTSDVASAATATPATASTPQATSTPILLVTPDGGRQGGGGTSGTQGPIYRFLVWLRELLPGISTMFMPLVEALPAILQWVLIILVVLSLLWLLWRLLKKLRDREEEPPQTPPSVTRRPPPPPPTPPTPALPRWISALPDTPLLPSHARAVATKTAHPLQDTLLIGLGDAGREVLAQVLDGLEARFGADLPKNIRLLQVDVVPSGRVKHLSPPPRLRDEQWVLLRPDFVEIETALRERPEEFAHWKWYEIAAADDGRAQGRMALFDDVKSGGNNSVLWRSLTKALQGLTSPVIRIIGTTFDDVSSGMLIDVARLTQLAATGDTDGNVDVQLWLVGPVGQDWSERLNGWGQVRADEQESRTLATLRELERFQRNAPVMFRYVPDSNPQDLLRAVRHPALISKVVLFDQPTRQSAEQPATPPAPPEDDVLACMADAILALFNAEANGNWDAHLDGSNATMGRLVNKEGKGAALAVGGYALRYPGAILAQVLAWYMLRDVLFEDALGLYPVERLNFATGKYQPLLESEQGRPTDAWAQDIEALVKRYRGRWDTPAFSVEVRDRVNRLLNGEDDKGEPLVVRRAGLMRAIRWLRTLRYALLEHEVDEIARKIGVLEKELSNWQQWFEERVYPLCKREFENAHDKLERLRKQPARNWGIELAMVWDTYRKYIRSWKEKPSGAVQAEPLLRLASRFGWYVHISDDGWRSCLIVPPGEFREPVEVHTLESELLSGYAFRLPDAQPEDFVRRLLALAERITAGSMQLSLLRLALAQDAASWFKRAVPRLAYSDNLATVVMKRVDHLSLLVVPESAEYVPQLAQNIEDLPDRKGEFKVCQTNDATAVTLLRATSWLPLSTLYMYNEEAWNTHPVPYTMYVWRPEQIAAEMEGDQRISALLRSRIAENESLLRAFGLAFLYQAMIRDDYGWHIPGIAHSVPGPLYAALEAVFAGSAKEQRMRLEALLAAVEKRRREIESPRTYLKRVGMELIKQLESQDVQIQKDLTIYLRGLIEEQ